jgi:hypothetical protein
VPSDGKGGWNLGTLKPSLCSFLVALFGRRPSRERALWPGRPAHETLTEQRPPTHATHQPPHALSLKVLGLGPREGESDEACKGADVTVPIFRPTRQPAELSSRRRCHRLAPWVGVGNGS